MPILSLKNTYRPLLETPRKVGHARRLKHLADLELVASCPLDAAKHAALAIIEFKALNDRQRYASALFTWCASVVTWLNDTQKTGLGCDTRHASSKYPSFITQKPGMQPISVFSCAALALVEFSRDDCSLMPLAMELVVKVCSWCAQVDTREHKTLMLGFSSFLLNMKSILHVPLLSELLSARVATVLSLLYRRSGWVRISVAVLVLPLLDLVSKSGDCLHLV
mmetsp:Transcript_16637/g.50149  ORF Transcript_16637/g.50149 Transcript_16637/m.50149 type:complete len:223 (-) Transcript_16637:1273-1941(-)